jgi:hypothetical protein
VRGGWRARVRRRGRFRGGVCRLRCVLGLRLLLLRSISGKLIVSKWFDGTEIERNSPPQERPETPPAQVEACDNSSPKTDPDWRKTAPAAHPAATHCSAAAHRRSSQSTYLTRPLSTVTGRG